MPLGENGIMSGQGKRIEWKTSRVNPVPLDKFVLCFIVFIGVWCIAHNFPKRLEGAGSRPVTPPVKASSFNGRTSDFDSDNGGSIPSLAANFIYSQNTIISRRGNTAE